MKSVSFWESPQAWLSIATIIAIVVGPLLTGLVLHILAKRDRVWTRRYMVFRDLMRTRRQTLHQDHVAALNLVEVEFENCPNVIREYRTYLKILEESVDDPTGTDQDKHKLWADKTGRQLTRLISEIAKTVNVKKEQMEILEGGYSPRYYEDNEIRAQMIQNRLLDVLFGRYSFPVAITTMQPPSSYPYPPKPSDTRDEGGG